MTAIVDVADSEAGSSVRAKLNALIALANAAFQTDPATDFAIISLTQSGSTFTNVAAGPNFIQTLPAFTGGGVPARFTFEVDDGDEFIIVANGVNAFNLAGIVSGDGGLINSNLLGSSITLQTRIGDNSWFAQSLVGEWEISAP